MGSDSEKFSTILKDYVSDRKKFNPKISESQIARNLGVSNTTFYRMLNYHTYPSVKNLLKLCKFIPKLKTLVTEEILEVIRESKNGQYMGTELENLLCRKSLFITYALALSVHGVTKEEVIYCIGYKGNHALNILIGKGLIVKTKNDIYKATKTDKGIILSFRILKKHLKILLSNYKPENVANNYIFYKIESLNKKGLKKLYEIYRETHKKVQEIMKQKEYKGDMPTFSAGFFDMFFTKEPVNKKREE